MLEDRGVSLIFHYLKRLTIKKETKKCIKRCGLIYGPEGVYCLGLFK